MRVWAINKVTLLDDNLFNFNFTAQASSLLDKSHIVLLKYSMDANSLTPDHF